MEFIYKILLKGRGKFILAKYVKFLRGTPTAYKNLAVKDNDTLYFIYEEDESNAVLYLGTKLIAGSNSSNDNTGLINNLSDLKDVLISEDIIDNSFLTYDSKNSKWINKTLEDLIFIGGTDLSAGKAGLVPAPEANQTDLFLKADGTWSAPEINHIILTLHNVSKRDHSEILEETTESLNNISGDIVIIKDALNENKWQYTAYVYDEHEWHAMDGNYNAENVYFTEDLITTSAIGNIELTNGQAIIPTAGKNLKEIFNTIFVQEKNPIIKQPSLSVISAQGKGYEVGNKITTSYSATFNPGSYEFGPATGVTVDEWIISDTNGNSASSAAASLGEILITDNLQYSITVTAKHGAGSIPQTNLKNTYSEGQIQSGEIVKTISSMYGYRNGFYGTATEKKEIMDSADIRKLSASNRALMEKETINVNIPIGAYRVIFAYPANLPPLTSIVDVNGLYSQILNSFTQDEVLVFGANDYNAIPYRVYYMDFANAYNESNIFIFTIGEEED